MGRHRSEVASEPSAMALAAKYLEDVKKSERGGNNMTLIFGDVPTLSSLPGEFRTKHLETLVEEFSEPWRKYYYTLYHSIGERLQHRFVPTGSGHRITNIMLRSSWERVITCQGSYRRFHKDEVMQILDHLDNLRSQGYDLLEVSNADLESRQGALWRLVKAWETIARVGQSLAVFRGWDLSLWWSESDYHIEHAKYVLESLQKLGRPIDWQYYRDWISQGKRPDPRKIPKKSNAKKGIA